MCYQLTFTSLDSRRHVFCILTIVYHYFATEATAIILALDCYQHMDPVHHDVVVYSDSISGLQAIEGEDTENRFIWHIMSLLWLLSDKGTHVGFCRIPSHCGIEGNESVDQLARESLDHDKDRVTNAHYADLKPLTGQLLYTPVGSNQMRCGCTWQGSISWNQH